MEEKDKEILKKYSDDDLKEYMQNRKVEKELPNIIKQKEIVGRILKDLDELKQTNKNIVSMDIEGLVIDTEIGFKRLYSTCSNFENKLSE